MSKLKLQLGRVNKIKSFLKKHKDSKKDFKLIRNLSVENGNIDVMDFKRNNILWFKNGYNVEIFCRVINNKEVMITNIEVNR